MILDPEELPEMDFYTAGQDFGMNMTNVKIGWKDGRVYAMRDFGAYNMTTKSFSEELRRLGWYAEDFPVYCDLAGGERIQETPGGVKVNDHYMDAMRYGVFSAASSGIVLQ
jgi:hypothetical protein